MIIEKLNSRWILYNVILFFVRFWINVLRIYLFNYLLFYNLISIC